MTRPIIAHATDLSGDDGAAFVHAAALAAASGAHLVTIHGNAPPEMAGRLPAAAPLAARWARPIDHERRCHECCDDVTDTVLDALRRLAPGMVVVGTHARHGLSALFHESVSESLARNLDVPTLVVPNRCRGFVDEATGAVDLRRVIVLATDRATAEPAVMAARRLAGLAGVTSSDVHVRIGGDLETSARDDRACLLVVGELGHGGLLEAVFGSDMEHVLHAATCPVLIVPAKAATAP